MIYDRERFNKEVEEIKSEYRELFKKCIGAENSLQVALNEAFNMVVFNELKFRLECDFDDNDIIFTIKNEENNNENIFREMLYSWLDLDTFRLDYEIFNELKEEYFNETEREAIK